MAKSFDSQNNDYDTLVTRASEYEKNAQELEEKAKWKKVPTSDRNKFFFLCKLHDSVNQWSSVTNDACPECIHFETTDTFPNGKLPTKYQVLRYVITLNKIHLKSKTSTRWFD